MGETSSVPKKDLSVRQGRGIGHFFFLSFFLSFFLFFFMLDESGGPHSPSNKKKKKKKTLQQKQLKIPVHSYFKLHAVHDPKFKKNLRAGSPRCSCKTC